MGRYDKKLFEENWSRIRGSMQGLQSGEKSFGIMRVAKIKNLGNMGASLQHTFRERETPNADPERMRDNSIFVGGASSKEVLSAWHDRAPEKIRSNAVHGLEYFVGGSPEKVKSMTRAEQDAYFEDALDWIKERHGSENVLSAVVHRDETTPHMSVMTIPLDERGKLNARSFVGNKKALSDLQTSFAENVSEKYGLRRGIKGSAARHERVQRVYGAYSSEGDKVELPVREKGSLLGKRESEDAWRERVAETTNAHLKSLILEMLDRERKADTNLKLANDMIETLEGIIEAGDGELKSIYAQLSDTREALIRLVDSLELADAGAGVNHALQVHQKYEQRVRDGDRSLIDKAAGSPVRLMKLVDTRDRLIPRGSELTPTQEQFVEALKSTLQETIEHGSQRKAPVSINIDTRPLPFVKHVLEHVAKDRTNPPFKTAEKRAAFRAEIETNLTDAQLDDLRAGEAGVLVRITGNYLSEVEQLRLAVAYYQHADIDVPQDVVRSVVERLGDAEFELRPNTKNVHKGPTH